MSTASTANRPAANPQVARLPAPATDGRATSVPEAGRNTALWVVLALVAGLLLAPLVGPLLGGLLGLLAAAAAIVMVVIAGVGAIGLAIVIVPLLLLALLLVVLLPIALPLLAVYALVKLADRDEPPPVPAAWRGGTSAVA